MSISDLNPADPHQRRCLLILHDTTLFGGLPRADLLNIAACSEIRTLRKGNYLFREGDQPSGFFVVGRGVINVHRLDEAGRETVIRVFRETESFGEMFLADRGPSPVNARAEVDSTVLLVRRADLTHLVGTQPDLSIRLLAETSRHLRSLVDKVEDFQQRSVAERLQNWILARLDRSKTSGPATVTISPSKRMLAAELGTVPETLSRTFGRFRERGWIELDGNVITLLNPEHFASLDLATEI